MKNISQRIICFSLALWVVCIVSAQETPPPPSPPYSSIYPDSTYVMTQEQIIGAFAVRLWQDPTADEFMFNNIAVIQWNSDFGGGYIQIESVSQINPLTGMDINGDGYADVIIETYTGGAHCCTSAHIYTLQPQNPIQIYLHRESNCGVNLVDFDLNGIYEILTCDDSFAYQFCPYAASYFVTVVLGYDFAMMNYVPQTSQYLTYTDFSQRIKNNMNTAENAVPGGFGEWDNTTKCQVLPLVLDYLYTDQTDLAWQMLNTYYTESDVVDFRAQIEAVVFTSPLYRPIAPPISDIFPSPLILDRQLLIDDYVVRIWKSGASSANSYDGIGQIVRLSDNAVLIQLDYVTEFPMNMATDINNNGIPDIVINTFTGGAHCCSSTIAYDLGATPIEILRTRESNYAGYFEDINSDGLQDFITADDIFAYAYCPYAFSPAVRVILMYDSAVGRYVPMSKFYPEQYADAIAESTTVATTAADGDFGEWDGTNKCAVLPVVLNYLYSGQYDMAWTEFYRLYRGADADAFRAEIESTVNSSEYYLP